MATSVKWQVQLPNAKLGKAFGVARNFGGGQVRFLRWKSSHFSVLRITAAAKGNVRQKQKISQTSKPPVVVSPGPISAPSLTEREAENEELANAVVEIASEGELSNSEKKELESRRLSSSNSSSSGGGSSWNYSPRSLGRKILRELSSLQLAIGELFAIAGLSALGTILEQNEAPQFYFDAYPEDKPLFGFLTWRTILDYDLDHIYSSWYYLGLILLLAASLIACSSTRQLPMVKVARRWSFMKSPAGYKKLQISDTLERAKLSDLATLLMAEGFEVFSRGPTLYAFRGLAGRYAPIGVHIALLLIMAGATLSAIGGYHGTVMVPQGLDFQIGDALQPNGILARPSPVMNLQVHVDKFYIDYRPNGEVSQFHSDLTLANPREELYKKSISVNDPLRYGGLTMYQTDWALSAVQVRVDGSDPVNLVMASLEKGDKKLFGTFLPLGEEGLEKAKGISILARDLQSVVFYDQEGRFVGVRRPGSGRPIEVDGTSILVEDVIGSTGLELKMDPGVPVVYAGFGALMLTSCISYLSHSQVWALQEGTSLVVGGKSNRAKVEFEIQLNKILDLVPELKNFEEETVLVSASDSQVTIERKESTDDK
ncbi:hypothetical protein R1flu_006703 [Riccia fluitans]|uniref:ResB-like domain-containing protein n=1 Tax=Riccia fluitans TaxID=41844 RepID=A0ABD1YWS5_9MARC